jgi:putative membrane protein
MLDFFAITPARRRLPVMGMLAGAIGGLIGGWFKLGWEVIWPPRALDRIPEPAVLITMFTHVPTPDWAGFIVHFSFSILSGMVYGAMVEFFPIVALGLGAAFGLVVWVAFHQILMPWMGLTPATWLLPMNEQGSEFFGHAVWGLVIGVFYEDFRRRFAKRIASPQPDEVVIVVPGLIERDFAALPAIE